MNISSHSPRLGPAWMAIEYKGEERRRLEHVIRTDIAGELIRHIQTLEAACYDELNGLREFYGDIAHLLVERERALVYREEKLLAEIAAMRAQQEILVARVSELESKTFWVTVRRWWHGLRE